MEQHVLLSHIKQFLNDHFQMVIATVGEHPWIATVYYTTDSEMNLYFLSDPTTIHCHQIAENPAVAVSIADAPQAPAGDKVGLSIYGEAEQVSGKNRIIHALNLWKNSLGVTSEKYSYEGMLQKAITGRMYKITPKKMKFFNTNLYEEEEVPLIEL